MVVKDQIIKYISEEILNNHEESRLDNNTNLIDIDIIDSMGILKLLSFLEEEFHIKLDTDYLVPENFGTIEKICELLKEIYSIN